MLHKGGTSKPTEYVIGFVFPKLTWHVLWQVFIETQYINGWCTADIENKVSVLSVVPSFMFLSDEGPTLEMWDFTFHIGSTPTFLYFDLSFNTVYAAHYVDLSTN